MLICFAHYCPLISPLVISFSYQCNKGFKLVGNPFRRCQENFTLDGSHPQCKPVDCGTPKAPENGHISLTEGTLFEAQVNYLCDEGYNLEGSATRTCLTDGQWSDKTPTCKLKECPRITPILNGIINSTEITYMSVVKHTCIEGFRLDGESLQQCQADGSWDKPSPSCQIVQCSKPTL